MKIAADKGEVGAMFEYASRLFNGDGIKANEEEAVKYFKMASDLGNTKAMYYYGHALLKGKASYQVKFQYYHPRLDQVQGQS